MQQALDLAVQRFEGNVAGREIETVVRDTATSPDKAVPAANSLVKEDGVDILTGGFSSSVCLAIQEVAGREQVPYFSGGGSTLQANGKNCNKYSFFSMASGWQFSGAGVAAYEQDLLDSLYFVQADYAGGEGVYNGVTSVMQSETDAEMAGRALAPLGNDDYSSQISKARESGADAVWAALVGADTITFLKQAESAGLTDEMTVLVGVTGNSVAAALSDETLSKIYGGAPFYWTVDGADEFSSNFADAQDAPPEWWSAVSFEGAMEALTAIKNADGSSAAEDVLASVGGRSFSWARKGTKWRECDNRAVQPYYLMQGVPSAERDNENARWKVVGKTGGEEIMRSCDATGCSL
jgi:branched-chain amino acid transport system substrate-binding protein